MKPEFSQEEIDKLERGFNAALQFVNVESSDRWPNLEDIKEIHRLIFEEYNPHVAGKYRQDSYWPAYIRFSVPQWHDVPACMLRLEDLLNRAKAECDALGEFERDLKAVEWAARIHHRLERIHPFEDGNGRTGRALATWMLYYYNLPFFNVSPKLRSDYIDALSAADEGLRTNDLLFADVWDHQTTALQPLVEFMADLISLSASESPGEDENEG